MNFRINTVSFFLSLLQVNLSCYSLTCDLPKTLRQSSPSIEDFALIIISCKENLAARSDVCFPDDVITFEPGHLYKYGYDPKVNYIDSLCFKFGIDKFVFNENRNIVFLLDSKSSFFRGIDLSKTLYYSISSEPDLTSTTEIQIICAQRISDKLWCIVEDTVY